MHTAVIAHIDSSIISLMAGLYRKAAEQGLPESQVVISHVSETNYHINRLRNSLVCAREQTHTQFSTARPILC